MLERIRAIHWPMASWSVFRPPSWANASGPACRFPLDDAWTLVEKYIAHYNNVRLHGTIGDDVSGHTQRPEAGNYQGTGLDAGRSPGIEAGKTTSTPIVNSDVLSEAQLDARTANGSIVHFQLRWDILCYRDQQFNNTIQAAQVVCFNPVGDAAEACRCCLWLHCFSCPWG